jgi:hypothetical protein
LSRWDEKKFENERKKIVEPSKFIPASTILTLKSTGKDLELK